MKKKKIAENEITNYIDIRTELLFNKYGAESAEKKDITVGIPYQFSVYTLWPFYSWFFKELNIKVILGEEYDDEGLRTVEAPFCFPGEVVHGTLHKLLKADECDFYFLPHFFDMESMEKDTIATLCPITQGLPYYSKIAFNIPKEKILKPIISFADGNDKALTHFLDLSDQLNRSKDEIKKAFYKGINKYEEYIKECKEIGKEAIEKSKRDNQILIVLGGRPYNAFTKLVNMGIPRKFTSRGYSIIPMDFLPIGDEEITHHMYWYYGQQILKAASYTRENPNLFYCMISNFSCAPDSFLLHYIKWIMGLKPFLVLELDSHTADAGIDTRVEAFLDIIDGYKRKLKGANVEIPKRKLFTTIENNMPYVKNRLTGELIPFEDKRIRMIIPPMGYLHSSMVAAFQRSRGIDCVPLPTPDRFTVQLARNVASGKECIPTLLVLGSCLQYFENHERDEDKIYCIFTPSTNGPCRTGQYATFYEQTFERMGWDNVIVLTLSSDNSYTELGKDFNKGIWNILVLGDIFQDIETSLSLLAEDKDIALKKLHEIYDNIIKTFETKWTDIFDYLKEAKNILSSIKLKDTLDNLKKVLIVGEIYVRRDPFSVNQCLDLFIKNGIYGKITGISEWIHYTDFIRKGQIKRKIKKNMKIVSRVDLKKQFKANPFKAIFSVISGFFKSIPEYKDLLILKIEEKWKEGKEHKMNAILDPTGLLPKYPHNMSKIVGYSEEFFYSADFETEATVSSGVAALSRDEGYQGVVAIAPFACLPGRLIKAGFEPYARRVNYPFIALENDGDYYPPSIINKLEIFMLNVKRQN